MDSSDVQMNQRGRASRSDVSVDAEVQKLLKYSAGGKSVGNSSDLLNTLRMKVNDERLVNKIQRAYVEKHTSLLKKARKFAKLIRDKYGDKNFPFHILLEKAYVFKMKHDLTNDEFGEFQRIYEQELVGLKSPDVYSYANNMVKLLGTPGTNGLGKLNDSDYKYVQEIVKLHANTKVLHSQVFLQSIQYEDTSYIALSGKYDEKVNNPLDHIHPVVAALFIPKVKSIEDNFVLANMANIIRTRYNNEPFTNVPDTKLYFDLINDPNDVVCDTRSPVIDVLNRCTVQTQLWDSVMSLRNGQYYGARHREFINGVDMCKLNKYDNPDLVYGRYDGTILKRLLSVFSFRPTVLACSPMLTNGFSTNPYQQNMRPVVTSVPMINLRLSPTTDKSGAAVADLRDAVQQSQMIMENGQFMLKQTSLIYSNDVLFFYVDRRSSAVTLNDLRPYNTIRAPTAISGFERVNTSNVEVPEVLEVRDLKYRLRSVVLSEVNSNTADGNIVVGSSALIANCANNLGATNYYHYNPMGVIKPVRDAGGNIIREQPVNSVSFTTLLDERPGFSFMCMARSRGVIFMYQSLVETIEDRKLIF